MAAVPPEMFVRYPELDTYPGRALLYNLARRLEDGWQERMLTLSDEEFIQIYGMGPRRLEIFRAAVPAPPARPRPHCGTCSCFQASVPETEWRQINPAYQEA